MDGSEEAGPSRAAVQCGNQNMGQGHGTKEGDRMIEILGILANILGLIFTTVGIVFGLLIAVLMAKLLYGIIRGTI